MRVRALVASFVDRLRVDAEGEEFAGEGLDGLECANPPPLGWVLEDAAVADAVLQVDLSYAELDDAVTVSFCDAYILVHLEGDPVA